MKASAAANRHAVRLERQREAKADKDDADIFDRVIGEKPLQIVLHQRVEHAHNGRYSRDCEHHDAPPPGRTAGEIEGDPHEAINGDLGHDAAHQGGDMARRRRVCERKPDMQRHDAGLRSGADEGPG